jgi:ketosteroid isomerase-like protein
MDSVELVRRVVETVEREGLEGLDRHFEELCRPDLEWRPAMVGFGKETYFGQEGYRQYLRDVIEQVKEISFRMSEIRPVDEDTVLVLGNLYLAPREGAESIDSDYAMLYRIEDGLVRSCVAYPSHREALEATGLA